MIIKLDKSDVNRVVENYYKKRGFLSVYSEFGLIYDEESNYVYPYIKVEKSKKRRSSLSEINYLNEEELLDIFSYTYNCNIKDIKFDKEDEVDLNVSDLSKYLYGINITINKKTKN